jgi:hypothetical protein
MQYFFNLYLYYGGKEMPTTTLKKATEELGVSLDDIVNYHKQGNKALIEIELKISEKDEMQNSGIDVFAKIMAMAEDIGIKDWSINHDHYLYGTPKRTE